MSRIAIIGKNSIEYVKILIDIWNNGHCAVLIDWRTPIQTICAMLHEAEVKICYVERSIIKCNENDLYSKVEVIEYDVNAKKAIITPQYIYDAYSPNYSQNEAVIIYSSGTTGNSKGVILSHFAITKNADAIQNYMHIQNSDRFCFVKSLSHSSTLVGELLVALKTRTFSVIFPEIVSINYFFDIIQKYEITIMCVNPTLLSLYANEYRFKKNFSLSLRTIYVSGSVIDKNSLKKAKEIFKGTDIFNVYGLTEAGPRVAAQRKYCCNGTSVGKPIEGVTIIIVDNDGNIIANGEKGNVYVKTPCRFTKYVTSKLERISKLDGWINTGDVGFIDNNNELFIIGRSDTCIIHQSHNIYPESVESVLMETNYFSDCKVEGDDLHLLCYYTTIDNKELLENDFREIVHQCKSKLAPYEIPTQFEHIEYLDRNYNGKLIRKNSVRDTT